MLTTFGPVVERRYLLMAFKRDAVSVIAALAFAVSAMVGSATSAGAYSGYGGFTSGSSWVQCGNSWNYTYIQGAVQWNVNPVYYWWGRQWVLGSVGDMVQIKDPWPIRSYCGPYRVARLFDVLDASWNWVSWNQGAWDGMWGAGCNGWWSDTNQWTLFQGCNHGTYPMQDYGYPAGYIRFSASVFPAYYAGGWTGSTGWRSLGG
jgi:hypothetical protein